MPVPVQDPINSSTANGTATVFAYDFQIFDEADLVVAVDGITKTLNVDYTVSGVGNEAGGDITFGAAPAAGASVLRYRDTALKRETDYQENGDLRAVTLDADFDRLWQAGQELAYGTKVPPRVMRAPVGESLDELPAATDRADSFLRFDSSGQLVAYPADPTDSTALAAYLASTASKKGAALVGEQRAEAGARSRTVRDKSREALSMLDFCVGDGATDETAQVLLAFACANSANLPLDLQGRTYVVSGSTLDLPVQGFIGQGRITGATCRWKEMQQVQQEGEFRCDSLVIDSVWYSSFDRLWVNGQLTIQSSNAAWGTFWNTFSHTQCGLLLFDAGQGKSVNLNRFGFVRANGGVQVVAAGTTSSHECHANYIDVLDTTGANITAADGTTGCHIVNDSALNQRNIIGTWYAEVSGSRVVQGNWDIRGSHVDATGTFIKTGRGNHFLGGGGTSRNGDFFAGQVINRCRGGDWHHMYTNGRPYDVNVSGGLPWSIVSVSDAPDGNPLALECTANGTFQSATITYRLGSTDSVEMTAWVKIENAVSATVEIERNGAAFSAGRTLVDAGNGWYLMRVAGQGKYLGDGSGSTYGLIRLYLTTGSLPAPAPKLTIGSIFVATEQTGFLPCFKDGPKIAFGTAQPAAGIWSVLDEWKQTSPTGGGVPGGLCIASGSPGSWKNFAAVAA